FRPRDDPGLHPSGGGGAGVSGAGAVEPADRLEDVRGGLDREVAHLPRAEQAGAGFSRAGRAVVAAESGLDPAQSRCLLVPRASTSAAITAPATAHLGIISGSRIGPTSETSPPPVSSSGAIRSWTTMPPSSPPISPSIARPIRRSMVCPRPAGL